MSASVAHPDPDEALTVEQVAAIAQMHPQTVRQHVREGRLIAHRPGGARVVRILRRDMRSWLEGDPVPPEPALEAPGPASGPRPPQRGSYADRRAIGEGRS